MRSRHAIFAAALLTPALCLSSFAQSRFTVATASAASGQKATGYLEVPAGVDAATNIPVVVVNGAKPGKVLAPVSGPHGTKYTPIIPLATLISPLTPPQLSRTTTPAPPL